MGSHLPISPKISDRPGTFAVTSNLDNFHLIFCLIITKFLEDSAVKQKYAKMEVYCDLTY